MKKAICILLFFPFYLLAQSTDSSRHFLKQFTPEGYVTLGAVSELWIVTHNATSGVAAITYKGKGIYFGGGFKTKLRPQKPFCYGIGINYLQYTMDNTLRIYENAQLQYKYFAITPSATLLLKSTKMLNYYASGDFTYMAAAKDNERSYYQFGLCLSAEYRAYEVKAGYHFCPGGNSPSIDINRSGWHDRMFTLGVTCYPYRILPHKKKNNSPFKPAVKK